LLLVHRLERDKVRAKGGGRDRIEGAECKPAPAKISTEP